METTRFDDEDSWEQELYEKIQRNNNGNGEPLETITEIDDEERDSSITSTTVSNNVNGDTTKTTSSKDVVCVCVDRNQRESSMDALSWTLQHWITPSSSTNLCLLYVFPFIRLIPSPRYMERVVVDSMHVDYHIEQIKDKKKLLLRKFIDLCTSSKVEVEPIPVECDESNNVAKAILKHVHTHGITKLVIGITKANLRRRSSKKKAVVNQILKKAPENCVVIIICEGNDVTFGIIASRDSPLDNGCNTNSIPRSTSSREHNYYRGLGFFMRYFGIPFSRKPCL